MANKKLLNQAEFFQLITKEGLSPNSYYLLMSMYNSVKPVGINVPQELRELKKNQWVVQDQDGKLFLLQKSYALIKKIDGLFKVQRQKVRADLMGSDFTEKIEAYREMWPNIKFPSKVYARVAVKNLESSFEWFFKNYDYGWETIYKATEMYLHAYEMANWKYAKNSQYFIRKSPDQGKTFASELANYCEAVVNGTEDNSNNHFETKIV